MLLAVVLDRQVQQGEQVVVVQQHLVCRLLEGHVHVCGGDMRAEWGPGSVTQPSSSSPPLSQPAHLKTEYGNLPLLLPD